MEVHFNTMVNGEQNEENVAKVHQQILKNCQIALVLPLLFPADQVSSLGMEDTSWTSKLMYCAFRDTLLGFPGRMMSASFIPKDTYLMASVALSYSIQWIHFGV